MENTKTVWSTITLNWNHLFSNAIEFQGKSVVLWTVDERGELLDSVLHNNSKAIIGLEISCIYCIFKQ